MTDLEIDKALALAIGWETHQMWVGSTGNLYLHVNSSWRVFSHKDWNVIGPIAARYECFPIFIRDSRWESISRGKYRAQFFDADTPQKAIALAVIGAHSGTKT